MARFYARFDSGSPSWNPNATTAVLLGTSADGFFQTRSIAATSASGALLRNGLIASRSAISTDIYVELDPINEDGGRGTYFPPDTFVVTSGVLTGSVYTSSVAGIVIPADYRTRPTASILSASSLVTASSPPDSASVTYDVYLSGSTAVKNVLDGIVGGGPYSRLGNNSSRTLHSIWHDEQVQYFAWDDFTPGTPTLGARSFYSGNTPSSSLGHIIISMSREYLNDFNQNASASLSLRLIYASSSGQIFPLPPQGDPAAATLTTSVRLTEFTSSANPNMVTYRWNAGPLIKADPAFGTELKDNQTSTGVMMSASVTFFDSSITSSAGTTAVRIDTTGNFCVVNGVTNQPCFIVIGTT